MKNPINPIYLNKICNELTGYTHTSLWEILQHLYNNYVCIYDFNIENKYLKMMKPCKPQNPLVTLIKQLEPGW